MLEFLADDTVATFPKGETILGAAQKILGEGEKLDIAVAYWGAGAIKALGIDGKKPTRIICDLLSGGCNPGEISKFLGRKFIENTEVRHLSNLHAKVYATQTNVIVGSANASANGLGSEGEIGSIEAAIHTDEKEVLDKIETWFQGQWGQAVKVTKPMIQQAWRTYRERSIDFNPRKTILEVLLDNPAAFRSRVAVVYYESEPTNAAIRKYREVAESRYTTHELEQYSDDEPFYQLGEPEDTLTLRGGDYVIDCGEDYAEIWQLHEQPTIPISKNDCIVLVSRRKRLARLKFPVRQQTILAKAVKEYHDQRGEKDTSLMLDTLPQSIMSAIKQQYAVKLARKA